MTINNLVKKVLPEKVYQNLFLLRHLQKLATRDGAYLVETGYIKSIKNFEPINKEGNPIPWMNYSFIDFLEPRLHQSMNIFEYGSGYSTLYLSDKVGSITSVEFDKSWFEKMEESLKDKGNCSIIFRDGKKQYIEAVKEYGNERFDIIIVDGRDRTECVKHIIPFLSDDGVIILDDSWKAKFDDVFAFFKENGFKELSFTGLKPGGIIVDKTTVFYKKKNVLNI
jgi:protein-L-isoaspartate O-methyltransferase